MAERFASISDDLAQWWAEQPMFFVATAPGGSDGHVNLSPKGLDTLRILGPQRVAYLDLTGSGVETIAHLRDNGRDHADGVRVQRRAADLPDLRRGNGARDRVARLRRRSRRTSPIFRAGAPIIDVDVDRVTTSCGYAVPLMDLVGDRERLLDWARAKGDDGLSTTGRRRTR